MGAIYQRVDVGIGNELAGASIDELARAERIAEAVRRSAGSPALLAGARAGSAALPLLLAKGLDAALAVRRTGGPLPCGSAPDVLLRAVHELGPSTLSETGIGEEAALVLIGRLLAEHGLDLSHPRAAAHLQPPPLTVAVAADALASASNASLDTYDSGPASIAIERWVISVLCKLARLGPEADGVLTPGGSLSNLLALLLARDAAALHAGIDARVDGVASLGKPIVFCSELAHFSVQRACAALGLGEAAVRLLPTDDRRRVRAQALSRLLSELAPDETPIAIVATAGTTDFGSVDPLSELADLAVQYGIWLHVDAAYGFGALFSDKLASKLSGLERADSVTLDLHKLGWQPAAASVLLVGNSSVFSALEREVQYLNPKDDVDAGLDGLLGRSLQTTRRPDAIKMAATLLAHGRRGLGDLVDICHELACHAEQRILVEPELELLAGAQLSTVVFRYRGLGAEPPGGADALNATLRRRLIESGLALIGRTVVRRAGPGSEQVCIKLTLLNPTTTMRDLDELFDTILRSARELVRQAQERVA